MKESTIMANNDFDFLAGLTVALIAAAAREDERRYTGSTRRRERAHDYRSASRKNLRNARLTPSSASNQVEQLQKCLANAQAARSLAVDTVGYSAIREIEDRIRTAKRHERSHIHPLHQDDLRKVNVI